MDDTPRLPARGGSTRIRRFNGLTRRTSDWDGLRRDNQLWLEGADCLVHFYNYGASQRGASLKVPFESVEKLNCSYFTEKCLRTRRKLRPIASDDGHSDSGRASISNASQLETYSYELYIPAPSDLTRERTFSYHLTTRNLLAYAVGTPLVGERLSTALIDLWNRLKEWRIDSPLAGLTKYLEMQGYLDFAENSEHALACLKFAEEARLRNLWIDSFVHCVGMHERLDLSPEFDGLNNITLALMTRASLEMDLHIGRVIRAVVSFLEEELGPERLGLSKPAHDHLDHFRSFLHSFYVDKLGWFPPREDTPWNESPWAAMEHDFQSLYDYLVDNESSCDWMSTRRLTGGVCVAQNVQVFDQKYGYEPLSHPLPLLPHIPRRQQSSVNSQRGLRTLKLGRTNSIPEPKITPSQALAIATNCLDSKVMVCSLVQEYQRFERQKLEGKLDIVEARKVRWLLIYGMLQMLSSIATAPKEVRDTETAPYPLCVLTTGCPPWLDDEENEESESSSESEAVKTLVPEALDALEGRTSRISIHPDCEADSAEDFFAANSSVLSLSSPQSTIRPTMPLSRTASFRSSMHLSVQALHKSVVGSLSRRHSNRRGSPVLEPRNVRSLCEIVVEAERIDVVDGDENSRPQTAFHSGYVPSSPTKDPLLEFDFDLAPADGEPILQDYHLEAQAYDLAIVLEHEEAVGSSPCESYFSAMSGDVTGSSRSSYLAEEDDSPGTDLSSWDGDSCRRDSEVSLLSMQADLIVDVQYPTEEKCLTYQPSNPNLHMKSACISVNAGCYVPSGMVIPPMSKFAQSKSTSAESLNSETGSVYAEESLQADIEVEEMRGRQKSGLLDNGSHFVLLAGDDDMNGRRWN